MIVSLNRFLVVSAVVPLLPQIKTKSYYTNFKITTHKHQFAPEQIMIYLFFSIYNLAPTYLSDMICSTWARKVNLAICC